MATVAVFLQSYDAAPDYDVLNRLICQWCKVEESTRAECGLPSVVSEYPGCFPYGRTAAPTDADGDDGIGDDGGNSTAETGEGIGRRNATDGPYTSPQAAAAADPGYRSRLLRRRGGGDADDTATSIYDTGTGTVSRGRKRPLSAHDIIMHNLRMRHAASGDSNEEEGEEGRGRRTPEEWKTIVMEDAEFEPEDFDWDEFIKSSYEQQEEEEETDNAGDGENDGNTGSGRRKLLDYEHVPWFNYFPLVGVRTEVRIRVACVVYDVNDVCPRVSTSLPHPLATVDSHLLARLLFGKLKKPLNVLYIKMRRHQYYYRYSGTQTVPPCYGWFTPDTRGSTNHWRIMKDPIRVSRRQVRELNRLLRERIAPADDPLRPCLPDTAAKRDPGDPTGEKVWTARPLQSSRKAHFKVFCECQDWPSKFEEDRAWCARYAKNQTERYYAHPYNFHTEGF